MINYDSILSAFDGKPTLLQWLKLVKKALDESVLKDITVSQDGASAVFTFNFEDGTSISTPAVTLPKGDTGAKGDKGEQGVSVTGVDEVSNEVVGGQTLTTLRFNFSNGTNNEVVVHAENGKNASGGGKLYLHAVKVKSSGVYGVPALNFKFISTSNTRITKDNIYETGMLKPAFDMILFGDDATVPPVSYIAIAFAPTRSDVSVSYFKTYPTNTTSNISIGSDGNYLVEDVITEL